MSYATRTAFILAEAAERARGSELDYRGAVTPAEAWEMVQVGDAKIIDVRTRFEREYVGRIADTGSVEWKCWPDMQVNPHFLEQLGQVGKQDELILFLCRSGLRSHAAAVLATQAGYSSVFNILGGFEGDLDEHQHRNTRSGWRKAGLPWIQG